MDILFRFLSFVCAVYQLKAVCKQLLYDAIDMLVGKGDDEIDEKETNPVAVDGAQEGLCLLDVFV